MKIQLTAKETRKLTVALSLLDTVQKKIPFGLGSLSSVKLPDYKFTINSDSTSEVEIHEKSFSTFLESGSEAIVKTGEQLKDAAKRIVAVWKSFDTDMTDARRSIVAAGEAYNKDEEQPEKEEDHTDLMKTLLDQISIFPADSEAIPYEVRLNVATLMVRERKLNFYKAVKQFNVKEADLRKKLG